MSTSRRGFLKALSTGTVGAVAIALPGSSIAIGEEIPGTNVTAFNFVCLCDRSIIGKVPKEIGSSVKVKCDCGRTWDMRWEGDHFQTRAER